MRMLRESSSSTPRTFWCGTAARSTSVGRNRHSSSSAEDRGAQGGEDDAVAPAHPSRRGAIEQRGDGEGGEREDRAEQRAGRRREAQFSLVEDDPSNTEQEPGKGVEHRRRLRRGIAPRSLAILLACDACARHGIRRLSRRS